MVALDDLDFALDLVKLKKKLSTASESNSEALKQMVKYTDKENDYNKKLVELNNSIKEDNKEDIELRLDKLEVDNTEIIKSIEFKNEKLRTAEKELGEKPFKISLPKFEKEIFRTLKPKLWQWDAFEPHLK